MADRKQLKNPNGLILGTPGSGKSFSAKREITNVFFTTTDDIIVADPEGEYKANVEAIRVLQTLDAEQRQATAEEQEILSRYVGWGGIPQAFD